MRGVQNFAMWFAIPATASLRSGSERKKLAISFAIFASCSPLPCAAPLKPAAYLAAPASAAAASAEALFNSDS
jgi:hypothetical protein